MSKKRGSTARVRSVLEVEICRDVSNAADEGSRRWDSARGPWGKKAPCSDHRRRSGVGVQPFFVQGCVDAEGTSAAMAVMQGCSEMGSVEEEEQHWSDDGASWLEARSGVTLCLSALVPPPALGSYASVWRRHRSSRNRGRRQRRRLVVEGSSSDSAVTGGLSEASGWVPATLCASDVNSRVAPSFLVVEEMPVLSTQLAAERLRVQPPLCANAEGSRATRGAAPGAFVVGLLCLGFSQALEVLRAISLDPLGGVECASWASCTRHSELRGEL